MPKVLSPRDLVFRPDLRIKTVHTHPRVKNDSLKSNFSFHSNLIFSSNRNVNFQVFPFYASLISTYYI